MNRDRILVGRGLAHILHDSQANEGPFPADLKGNACQTLHLAADFPYVNISITELEKANDIIIPSVRFGQDSKQNGVNTTKKTGGVDDETVNSAVCRQRLPPWSRRAKNGSERLKRT